MSWKTYRTVPLGFLLVHHEVSLGVETLEVVAGAGPGGRPHPVLGQGAGQAHLAGGRGDLRVLVVELLLDEGLGVDRVPHSLLPELVQEIQVSETLHNVDGGRVGLIGHCGPGDSEAVRRVPGDGGG